jgi:hypothetical protein
VCNSTYTDLGGINLLDTGCGNICVSFHQHWLLPKGCFSFVALTDYDLNIEIEATSGVDTAVSSGVFEVPDVRVFVIFCSAKAMIGRIYRISKLSRSFRAVVSVFESRFIGCQNLRVAFRARELRYCRILLRSANNRNPRYFFWWSFSSWYRLYSTLMAYSRLFQENAQLLQWQYSIHRDCPLQTATFR